MPAKLPFPGEDPGFLHNRRFLVPTRVHIPNGISIASAVLAQLVVVANSHTDHATSIVATDRICTLHARDAA